MATYTKNDLPSILRAMAEYVENCNNSGEDITGYFKEIFSTSLFEDSEGKVQSFDNGKLTVRTDY